MSFDPDNPTAIIKDGLIFAADFVEGMPEDEDEDQTLYEDDRE